MAKEDFPYCVYCGGKVLLTALVDLILTYTCPSCGESVEVQLYDEYEKLLRDSGTGTRS